MLLSYIALSENNIFTDGSDPNDKTAVEINEHIPTEIDKHAVLTVPSLMEPTGDKPADLTTLTIGDNLATGQTDNKRCCNLFCDNCIPQHLLLKGCWYEEQTAEEQQQEIACALERQRQRGVNEFEVAPYHPIVRIRHHPDGRKLVFTTRGMYFQPTAQVSTHVKLTVARPL